MWLYGPSRANACGYGEERDLGAVTGKRSVMNGWIESTKRFALRGAMSQTSVINNQEFQNRHLTREQ